MTDGPADPMIDPQLQEGELVLAYDWLRVTCHVIQTIALVLIAIALIAD